MRFDPERAIPRQVRCTGMRCHDGRCGYRPEDALEWADMPAMESYRCDYMIVNPVSDGTYTGLKEGRHE